MRNQRIEQPRLDTALKHGPNFGCNYQACGNPNDPEPCPFVKDAVVDFSRIPELEDAAQAKVEHVECQHEWRQHWTISENTSNGDPVALPDGYYCIHCLSTTTSKAEHGITTVDNRGSWQPE